MSYITRLNSKISKYGQEDYSNLISFRRRMWPDHPSHLEELHWNWQFQHNPNNPTPNPELWVFKDDGQILGHQGAIPVHLKVGDTYYRSSWAIALIVDPRFRNKGIGYLLTTELNKSTDVTLALGISDAAYPMYKRDGWMDMGTVPRFVKILNARPFVRTRLRVPVISGVLSVVMNSYLKLRDASIIRGVDKESVQIEQIDHFDKHFDEFWEYVSGNFTLIACRDREYLNWKYVSQPGMNYIIFQMKNGGKVLGYAILRIFHRDDRIIGHIVDLLALEDHLGPLIARAIRYFREKEVTAVVCHILSSRIEALMGEFGFHRRESDMRFMVKVNNSRLGCELFRERDNWLVTCGDSDVDRPWRDR